jgi:hypothetical protein
MSDRAKRRKRKHYRRRSWSPYALSGRLLQDTKAQDSADDRLQDYEEASAVPTNNRRHRATRKEKIEQRFREFMAWARERW